MGAEARTWVSPALCGCEIELTAEWSSPPADDGKMYQHPASAPGVDRSGKTRNTVQFAKIMAQCATHAGWEQGILWNPFAVMGGYADIPASPSPGLCLYVNHWRFTTMRSRLTLCECEPHYLHDASDNSLAVVQHPQTRRCKFHVKDDDQHTVALGVESARAALQVAFEALPSASQPLSTAERDLLAKLVAARDGVPLDSVTIPTSIPLKTFKASLDDTGQIVVETAALPLADQQAMDALVLSVKAGK
jgi:hypothetical protein